MTASPPPLERLVLLVHRGMSDHRFPVFLLSLIVGCTLSFGSLMVLPASGSGLGALAGQFRVWCFGEDARTGVEWAYAVSLLGSGALLSTPLVWLWWLPLRRAAAERRRGLVGPGAAGLLAALALLGGLLVQGGASRADELPFPADRIRTALEPPAIDLVDQDGARVVLSELEGQVVLLTSVYATCGYSCPMILQQARRAAGAVPAELRGDLTVVAVTIDPEHDTPGAMREMARAQRVASPLFRLVTGDPSRVARVLGGLGVERRRDERTGMIDHSNLFAVVDRGGRIAYRFTLGDQQERWLSEALTLLLREGTRARLPGR